MKKLSIYLAIILPVLITSCSDVSGPGGWYDENFAGNVYIRRVVTRTPDSTTVQDYLSATFKHPDSSAHIAVGTVVAGNAEGSVSVSLQPNYVDAQRGTTYSAQVGDLSHSPVRFNGPALRMSIAGNAAFPAFTYDVPVTVDQLAVASPGPGDIISRSKGFVIDWDRQNPAKQVMISIYKMDDQGSFAGVAFMEVAEDKGSFTLTPDMLAGTGDGRKVIRMERVYHNRTEAPGGRRITTNVYSEVWTHVTFAP